MIVIAYKPGQLANQLFLFAKIYCVQLSTHHCRVLNPAFRDYAVYFETTANPAYTIISG